MQNYWAISLHIMWVVPLPFAAILHCSHLCDCSWTFTKVLPCIQFLTLEECIQFSFFSFNFFLVYMYGQNLGQEKKHNMCWKLWHRLVAFSKLCNSYLQQIHIERCKLNKPKCDLLHELHTSSVCFCHLLPRCPCSNQFSPAWKDGL